NVKPLCFIIYADKTELSNTNDGCLGGGRLVGWLPILEESEAYRGKSSFVDFKRKIWHESMKVIFKSISTPSHFGHALKCGDGEIRRLFPNVIIVSSDYEEQCVSI
ncbi:hypothetical protein FA15DRAFT_606592, partial [Coprinopsis marcescibilis]